MTTCSTAQVLNCSTFPFLLLGLLTQLVYVRPLRLIHERPRHSSEKPEGISVVTHYRLFGCWWASSVELFCSCRKPGPIPVDLLSCMVPCPKPCQEIPYDHPLLVFLSGDQNVESLSWKPLGPGRRRGRRKGGSRIPSTFKHQPSFHRGGMNFMPECYDPR